MREKQHRPPIDLIWFDWCVRWFGKTTTKKKKATTRFFDWFIPILYSMKKHILIKQSIFFRSKLELKKILSFKNLDQSDIVQYMYNNRYEQKNWKICKLSFQTNKKQKNDTDIDILKKKHNHKIFSKKIICIIINIFF